MTIFYVAQMWDVLFPRFCIMFFSDAHHDHYFYISKQLYLQDPSVSKMILASNDYGCSEEAITIAAVLSIQVYYLFSQLLFSKYFRSLLNIH